MTRILHSFFALVLLLSAAHLAVCQDSNTNGSNSKNTTISDPLVRMLMAKGLLTENEARSISESGNAAEQRDRLANLLREKGIISAAEYEAVRAVMPVGDNVALSAKSSVESAENTRREELPPPPQAAATPSD